MSKFHNKKTIVDGILFDSQMESHYYLYLKELKEINLVNINFSENLPLSPLHWIISDKNKSLTVESVKDGLKIYENKIGVLTNNPTFDYHLMNLNNY